MRRMDAEAMLKAWCTRPDYSFHVPEKRDGFYLCENCGIPVKWSYLWEQWLDDMYVIEEVAW